MTVSLNKVVLAKQGDSHKVDLSKASDQKIVINLNWHQNQICRFLSKLFGGSKDIDLDLGCYYELVDGSSSVIDGLQFSGGRGGAQNQLSRQGRYTAAPWIWHCGDDRSGSSDNGENILVNPNGIRDIRRIIVYCFIYDGVAKWADSDAVVTVKVPNQPDIVVEMGQQNNPKNFCAIASIEFSGSQMSVKKEVTFHKGHDDCDRHYGWGMKWEAGSK